MTEKPVRIKPFLKWVGGKRSLAPRIVGLFPRTIKTYYEPFVGGGAVFWSLPRDKYESVVLNDFNAELMNCYKVVRDFPDELLAQVKKFAVSKEFFLELRAKLPEDFSPVRRAARTIFLNKTTFNGLYRVNKAGGFNAPWGKYKNPTLADPEVIQACSDVLEHAKLTSKDFAEAVKNAKHEDVVYFDPPYVEVSKTANFKSYTSSGFGLDDQQRLADTFRDLVKRGVAVLASNSDTPVVREMYATWEVHEVKARRAINSKASARGPVGELIIVGRPR
jgi:DNA adenine methylase